MPTLKAFRESKLSSLYQTLPSLIQEKVHLIEFLHERATVHLEAKAAAPMGVPDFDAHLRGIIRARAKQGGDTQGEPLPINVSFMGLNYGDWVMVLGDPRYRPDFENLEHLITMFGVLWVYWMVWPRDRRIFGKEQSMSPIALAASHDHPGFEAALDHSLTWLAYDLGGIEAYTEHWGKQRETLIRRHIKLRTDTSQRVFEAFSQVKKETGDSFNRIVTRIYNKLEHEVSKSTITRYLKNNQPLIARYFKSEEIGKIKRIVLR